MREWEGGVEKLRWALWFFIGWVWEATHCCDRLGSWAVRGWRSCRVWILDCGVRRTCSFYSVAEHLWALRITSRTLVWVTATESRSSGSVNWLMPQSQASWLEIPDWDWFGVVGPTSMKSLLRVGRAWERRWTGYTRVDWSWRTRVKGDAVWVGQLWEGRRKRRDRVHRQRKKENHTVSYLIQQQFTKSWKKLY